MFEKLGHAIAHRSKAIFLLSVTLVLLFGTLGTQVFSRFDSGGYSDPNSDSAKVFEYLEDTFGVKDPAVVITLESSQGSVDNEATVAAATSLESNLRNESSAENVISYWSAGRNPAFKSTDGTSAYIFVYLKSDDFTEIDSLGGYYQDKYEGTFQNERIRVAGGAVFANAINGRIQDDLKLSEAISIPLTFIMLVLVFGALVASAMPLVIGVTAILGTFFGLYLLTLVTDVSIFALNLTTGLGLGLGIDYALLIVNRFREEIARGISREDAIVNTMRSAGKTVFYSGLTVVLTLISLAFFPMNFLKSMGYAGAIVVALAVVGALIPLPALLMMLGEKVNKGVVRKSGLAPKEDGGWASLSRFVMKRPIPVVAFSLIVLGLMIAPLNNVKFSQVDSRVLPASDPAYQASAFIEEKFPGQEGNPIEIIFPNAGNQIESVNEYAAKLAQVKDIVRVGTPDVKGEAVRLIAVHSMAPRTPEAQDLINRIRAIDSPIEVLVGGIAADYADTQDGIAQTLPWVFLWIAITVLVLLFLFTGSVLLPIKAIILNFASLAATIGVLTLIFIEGKFTFLVGDFIQTGSLDTSTLVLIAVVAFGLSMDYEVFLLSRIKEEHDAGKSNVESVALGLQKSARIITAAAFILAIVFAAFIISGVTSIKSMGFGIAFAILLDATLIRALLVPALMRLFGDWNWWAPKALRRFQINH
ncbi:MAG: MMPL family transporter [Actinobacteria bacterium]|jgi:RND superfamily putative drug exporter|nr:MMPL family transporter [Actinomycetota bacterium]NDE12172.1 MMPL family transporter [Actinomycetota bacterium]